MLALAIGRVEGATWLEARTTMEQLASVGEFSAAVKLEQTLIDLVVEEFGDPSFELAESYMFMASVHAGNRDDFAVEAKILDALELYALVDGAVSTRLIEPYIALGDNYHRAREYDLALGAYDEARSLSRRAFGLLNRGQLALLDKMSESALGRGRFDEADDLQHEALILVERMHGENSLEALDAHYRYTEWLGRHLLYRSADLHFYEINRIIRRHFDDDPWLRLRLLRVDAGNFLDAAGYGTGHRSEPDELEQALNIVAELDDPEPLLRAEILLELGDWNVAFARPWEIEDAYVEAWELLSSVEDGEEIRQQWFSDLTIITSAGLYSRNITTDPRAPWGRLEIEFTIDTDGRADEFVILKSEPLGLLDDAGVRQLKESRFRPRMANGLVVESTGKIGWDYQYVAR